MRKIRDTHLILVGLVAALCALVVVALLGSGSADAELTEALSYAVVGLTGALAGSARRSGPDGG